MSVPKARFRARRCSAALGNESRGAELSFSKVVSVEFCSYRWVNDLTKIRKPAFQRQQVQLGRNAWREAICRMTDAWNEIQEIEKYHEAAASDECFRCPYKEICPQASTGYSSSRTRLRPTEARIASVWG